MAVDRRCGARNRAGGFALAGLTAAVLAGCAAAPRAAPRPAAAIAVPYSASGLERVIGQPAAALTALFGQPQAEMREGVARKLQFAGPICVLDTYLYAKGTGEPVVTYVDARELDGGPIDRASCVAALSHREHAR